MALLDYLTPWNRHRMTNFRAGPDIDHVYMAHVGVGALDSVRRADLWSGVGLACAYAGGLDARGIESLQKAAGPFKPQLAQGAAFAAKTRQRAGNETEHTALACRILCRVSAEAAALITDAELEHLHHDLNQPAYEVWRQKIQARFASEILA